MVLPSGENATELTMSLCALCFSALSFREAVASVQALSLVGQVRNMAGWATCIPDFDRLVH